MKHQKFKLIRLIYHCIGLWTCAGHLLQHGSHIKQLNQILIFSFCNSEFISKMIFLQFYYVLLRLYTWGVQEVSASSTEPHWVSCPINVEKLETQCKSTFQLFE